MNVNAHKSYFDNFVCTKALNKDIKDILGINCFDELLFLSDIRDYAKNFFFKEINEIKIYFYSKRLNLYVCKMEDKLSVIYLKDDLKILIENPFYLYFKSLKIEDKEVLRIFLKHKNKITLKSFF
jgi:hypothetical protein